MSRNTAIRLYVDTPLAVGGEISFNEEQSRYLGAVMRLAPGDVVLLSAGDRIPADCRVLESIGLRVEESALTGESQPVEKSAAPLPDDGHTLPPSACSK